MRAQIRMSVHNFVYTLWILGTTIGGAWLAGRAGEMLAAAFGARAIALWGGGAFVGAMAGLVIGLTVWAMMAHVVRGRG